jgi:archaeal chaperonin
MSAFILRKGSKDSGENETRISNFTAAKLTAELLKSALGPRSMDKMLVDSLGDVTVTSDGATILKEIVVEHPVCKMLVGLAKSVDKAVGDGTKSVVLLVGALVEKGEELIDLGVHPTIIVDGFRKASIMSIKNLSKAAKRISPDDRNILTKVANTSMQSKLVEEYNGDAYLAGLVVDAALHVAENTGGNYYRLDADNIKVQKKEGGSVTDTRLVRGIVLDNEVVDGLMPKRVKNAIVALLNVPLQLTKTKFDTKLSIESAEEMKAFMDEEDRMLRALVDKVVQTGANVVVCQKGIDESVRRYLANAGIMAVRRVKDPDMVKLSKATGGKILTDIRDLTDKDLGRAGLVEERRVGNQNWVFLEECNDPKSLTIVIRGGSQRIVEEVERSIHDALMVLKDVMEKPAVVSGGGATEAYIARQLIKWANKLSGREQLAVRKFAEALETIPFVLAENAGMDPLEILADLSSKQHRDGSRIGVDVRGRKVANMMDKGIIESLLVKEQVINSATETVSMILRIDHLIAKPRQKEEPKKLKGIDIEPHI